MLRTKSNSYAHAFSTSISQTLSACTDDIDELTRSLDKGHIGRPGDAQHILQELQCEVREAQQQTQWLVGLKNAVGARELLDVARKQYNFVEGILDAFERSVQERYDVAPVAVTQVKIDQVKIADSSTDGRHGREGRELHTPKGVAVTDDYSNSPDTPKTPRLEDFGICDADIAALSIGGVGVGGGAEAGSSTRFTCTGARNAEVAGAEGPSRVGMGGENESYDAVVAKSMQELGIETPGALEDRFAQRRHVALQGVMQTTTPRMRGGGREHTLDLTGLAGGYSASGMKGVRRGGLFEEEGDGVRERVLRVYEEGRGVWKGVVSAEMVVEAAAAVAVAVGVGKEGFGKEGFGKEEVVAVLEGCVGKGAGQLCLMALTDLGVVKADKQYGREVVYRYAF